MDIVIGYGEKTTDGHYFNTCSYIHAGQEVSKYRKVHLPGNREPYPDPEMVDQLEKRYFEPGDYGFRVGVSGDSHSRSSACVDAIRRSAPLTWRPHLRMARQSWE